MENVVCRAVADHCMEDDESFEHNLGHGYGPRREDKRGERTMTLGSRNLGDRALQTSCTAPSSDQVAAMIGSRYCVRNAGEEVGDSQRALGDDGEGICALAFGGAALGLQASLTVFSKLVMSAEEGENGGGSNVQGEKGDELRPPPCQAGPVSSDCTPSKPSPATRRSAGCPRAGPRFPAHGRRRLDTDRGRLTGPLWSACARMPAGTEPVKEG